MLGIILNSMKIFFRPNKHIYGLHVMCGSPVHNLLFITWSLRSQFLSQINIFLNPKIPHFISCDANESLAENFHDTSSLKSNCDKSHSGSYFPYTEDQCFLFKKYWMWDFPGSPVVKTPHLAMQGLQVPSLVGKLRSHIMLCGVVKNK